MVAHTNGQDKWTSDIVRKRKPGYILLSVGGKNSLGYGMIIDKDRFIKVRLEGRQTSRELIIDRLTDKQMDKQIERQIDWQAGTKINTLLLPLDHLWQPHLSFLVQRHPSCYKSTQTQSWLSPHLVDSQNYIHSRKKQYMLNIDEPTPQAASCPIRSRYLSLSHVPLWPGQHSGNSWNNV